VVQVALKRRVFQKLWLKHKVKFKIKYA